MRAHYPLQWPSGWKRTRPLDRRRSPFGKGRPLSAYETGKELVAELRRLGAARIVITSFLPTRDDGLPYSDGRSEDPGIAVWFVLKGHERVFAADVWATPGENLRAIARSIEAMRGLERWGMADVVGRAFAGFAALPAGAPEAPSWRVVLGVEGIDLGADDMMAVVKARHRGLIKTAHPDNGAGGDLAKASALNAALDAATLELQGAK
jgi:hypothetical protein